MTLQDFILKEMQLRGLRAADLARMAGLKKPSSLYCWLQGIRGIDWKTLKRIIYLLNIRCYSDYQPPPNLKKWLKIRKS